ncbi:MAG: 50S ribosomal protein L11 methyltransferase [Thermomicrobiales bacterium]
MRWLEVRVSADTEAVEAVSELFARYGYQGGVAIEEQYLQDRDGDNLRVDTNAPVTVATYIADTPAARETIHTLEQALWHLSQMRYVGEITVQPREDEDWANAWKEHFHVHRIGRSIVIRPPWQDYEVQPGDRVVTLDPGMAFGTGLHPSTQLCLIAVEDLVRTGDHLLDVGTGSGILAIAALRMGAAYVLGLDVEEVAVQAARSNGTANGINAESFPLIVGSLGPEEHYGTFDGVFANIIARIIRELAPYLYASVRPNGWLIASGIIIEREEEVWTALEAAGFVEITRGHMGDWVALRAWRR